MHPSESIRSEKSRLLAGKHVVLGITGSIAAVQCFELTRELIRHGAKVTVVMSQEATRLITPCSMEFASGQPVITEISGGVEHVDFCGSSGEADMLLIAPCTANTLSKIATGIDDTPVTTMATTAIGSGIPVIIAPAMHGAMYNHPMVREHLKSLARLGVETVGPRSGGEKAKMAGIDEIVARVIRRLGRNDFMGIKTLVIGGSSEEPIDRMRIITNRGTGETALELALAAFMRGADVELWMGRHSVSLPDFMRIRRFTSVRDLIEMADGIRYDLVLVPAALSDFGFEETEGKIPSLNGPLTLTLKPLPKVLPELRRRAAVLVGFKAEYDVDDEELERRARERLESIPLEAVVANDLKKVKPGSTDVTILLKGGDVIRATGTKREVAHIILDNVLKVLR